MTEPSKHPSEDPGRPAAHDLGRSYEEFLGQPSWEMDVGEIPVEAPAVPSPLGAEMPPPEKRIIEALLFVGGRPLTLDKAREIVRGLTEPQLAQAIAELNLEYHTQGRPYDVQAQDEGLILTLRPRYRSVVDRLYGSVREARLSPSAVDVLSLVAYRQPCTKQEIDSLRGAESGSWLRQLVRRNLVAIVRRGEATQRDVAYGTTARFLELFGLDSLEDLPRTQDLQIL